MAYDIPPPDQRPESGYYYHFKHDPAGPLNNYAYYIYGVGHHTEDDCRTEDSFMQVGREVPRFTQITDAAVIAELQAIKARMYGDL